MDYLGESSSIPSISEFVKLIEIDESLTDEEVVLILDFFTSLLTVSEEM